MASNKVAIRYVSPVSAFKTALAVNLVGLAAWVICVAVVYFGLDAAGIWNQVNDIIGGIGGQQAITFGLILSVASLIGAIVALALAILAPLAAIVYNSLVDLFGGIQVTLREEDF